MTFSAIRNASLGMLLLLGLSLPLAGQLATKRTLTLAAAKKIAAAAQVEAIANKWNVVIAVVDDAGHLIYQERMDGTQLASVELAPLKAKAALLYKRNSKELDDMVAAGRLVLLRAPGAFPADGGVLVVVDGEIVGAVGVSGVLSSQDAQVARAGIAAFLADLKK